MTRGIKDIGEEVIQTPKRKADEAFAQPRQRLVQPSSIRNRASSKVVTFQDGDDHDENSNGLHRSESTLPNHVSSESNKVGRLKTRAQSLVHARQSLPIYPHANEIRSSLVTNDVLLLVGETGSGKSTQVPQFLLDQGYVKRTTGKKQSLKVGGCIAITQPRRVAAISLARRVAEEIGTPLGNSSPASQVGYSVRFDNSAGPNTRIKFLTDGMLLQELLRDPWLREYSVVVVDEVHERGVNVDLVLGFLKRIIQGRHEKDGRGGVPLKVVVMSATADMERIKSFFSSDKEREDQAIHHPTAEKQAEDKAFQGSSDGNNPKASKDGATISQLIRTTSCFIKGRQYPVQINYTPQPVASSWDSALDRIIQIHQHTPLPGDVLCFLPGQDAIDSVESMCTTYASSLMQQAKQKGAPKLPKLLILPLFAALPTAAQQRVFEATPPFTRKIILSTNIAETSVTVPGIRHVIDTGKRKARFFRPSLNLDTLLTKPISRSSAKQRAGRAGREAPGTCWRLYTEKTFYELEADTEPEILRCDLSQLVLTLKAHDIDDVLSFPLLTQPPIKALERALLHLLQLKALHPKTGQITDLGRRMSSLPLPANLARLLLASVEPQYDCLTEIIDIVSGLSVENIWLPIHNRSQAQQQPPPPLGTKHSDPNNTANGNPIQDDDDNDDEETNPIEIARRTLYRRSGDHMTLLAAMQTYATENTDRKAWCRRHGISHRAMSAAMDVRKQLTKLTSEGGRHHRNRHQHQQRPPPNSSTTGRSSSSSSSIISTSLESLETRILRCLLTGLHTNTATLQPSAAAVTTTTTTNQQQQQQQHQHQQNTPYKTYYTGKPLQIHPSSTLFTRDRATRPADIMFSEFVYTARPYARCVSEVRGDWIEGVMADVDRGE